jgi:hypothetical protein
MSSISAWSFPVQQFECWKGSEKTQVYNQIDCLLMKLQGKRHSGWKLKALIKTIGQRAGGV